MSGGFFRGTSADQDTRFSNKHAKLMKSQKFASELEHLVDMSKVKMDVLKPWIATRVTEFLGFEDEVLINFIYGLLEGKLVNGKEVQIQLTGFMEKNTGKFMRELWTLLMSAEKNATGVPQQFLDAKEEETRNKKAEADQIANEIKKRKYIEDEEFEQEKLRRKMDGAEKSKAVNAAMDSNSKSTRRRDSSADRDDGSQRNDRIGSRQEKSISKSPARRSSRGKAHSRSMSKSPPQSRSPSRSRSLSKSPLPRGRSTSFGKSNRSPQRRSETPRRRHSPRGSISPSRRKPSHYIGRSRSPLYRRSVSPVRRRIRSPLQRRSPNPQRQRSSSPTHRRSPLAPRQRSPYSYRRRSPPLRSRSPVRRRFRSPLGRRSRSPESRSPVRRRSPYPARRRSPSPVQRRSPSPVRRRSRSPVRRRSPSPVRRRSPSPVRRRSPSPVRRRSPSPVRRRSPYDLRRRSPYDLRRRSPSPVRRMQKRSPSISPHGSPLDPQKSPISGSRRSPIPSRDRSASTYGRSSISPIERIYPSPARREMNRAPVQKREGFNSVTARPPSSFRSPQRDARDHINSRKRAPSWSLSPDRPQTLSESSPGALKKIVGKDRNPHESPVRPPPKEHKSLAESPKRSGVKEVTKYVSDHKSRSYPTRSPPPSSAVGSKEVPSLARVKEVPERSGTVNVRKRNLDSKSGKYPEVIDKQGSPQMNKHSHLGDKKDLIEIKADVQQEKPGPASINQIDSIESDLDDSGKGKYKAKEKRKHKKSGRHDKDSQLEDRKEAKRRRKEEKKEERRRRHEEKREKKREERRLLKTKENKEGGGSSEGEEEMEKKRMEMELRRKAIESLEAKKGIRP